MTSDPDRTPLVTLSPRWQYSLKQLLLWTAMVAVFCLALKNASAAWSSAMLGLALVVLTATVLLAIFRQGAVRAWWIGFAVCGWMYLALLFYGWSFSGEQAHNPLRQDVLITSYVSAAIYAKVYPWIKTVTPEATVDPFGRPGGPYPDWPPGPPYEHNFVNVAHALWTLLLAVCGGMFAHWLYLTAPARSEPSRSQSAGSR